MERDQEEADKKKFNLQAMAIHRCYVRRYSWYYFAFIQTCVQVV
jgi:hypothetical protein